MEINSSNLEIRAIKSENIDDAFHLKDMPVGLLQSGSGGDVSNSRVERPLAITSCVPRYESVTVQNLN